MNKEANLIVKIENLRELMHDLIIKEGNLSHFKVIRISQELDMLLNEYNRVISC